MEIRKQDVQNLGRKSHVSHFHINDSFARIWLSGVGIADILDGAIHGTVHQHIVNDHGFIFAIYLRFFSKMIYKNLAV